MDPIDPMSHHGRMLISDGRSSEAQYLKRIRAGLSEQCGGSPSAAQQILIGRIAVISLRLELIDRDPLLPDRVEYLDLTKLLAQLLGQLSAQPAATNTVPSPFCGAAA